MKTLLIYRQLASNFIMDSIVRNGNYIEIVNQRQKTELHHRKKPENMYFHDSQLNTKPYDSKQALLNYKAIQPHPSSLLLSQSPLEQRLQAIEELQSIKSQIASQGISKEEGQAFRKQIEYIQSKLLSKKGQIRLLQVSQPIQPKPEFQLLQTQLKVELSPTFIPQLQRIEAFITSTEFTATIQKFEKLQKIVGYLAGDETWSADEKVFDLLQSYAKYDNLYDKFESILASMQSLQFAIMGLQSVCNKFREEQSRIGRLLKTTEVLGELVQKLK